MKKSSNKRPSPSDFSPLEDDRIAKRKKKSHDDEEPIPHHEGLVGVDEVGRGCIFGPVFVAAGWYRDTPFFLNHYIVVLDRDFQEEDDIVIRDSKKMSEKQIARSAKYIKKNALEFKVSFCLFCFKNVHKIGFRSNEKIDKVGINPATMEAIHQCLSEMKTDFTEIVMDGNEFKPFKKGAKTVPHRCIPRADSRCKPVACASIVAKYARDSYIHKLCKIYPELNDRYDVDSNVGYPGRTDSKHSTGIKKHGISQFHRKSYSTCTDARLNPVKMSEDGIL